MNIEAYRWLRRHDRAHSAVNPPGLTLPVLDVFFIGYRRGEKGNLLRTANPPAREKSHSIAPRSGCAMVAVDQVVETRGNFSQHNRSRQVRRTDSLFIRGLLVTMSSISDFDRFDGELLRVCIDAGE